ncbi:MAG: TonB family protein [Odoribacter sp.]|nr:TonB family protein [Odoribacter sp.]
MKTMLNLLLLIPTLLLQVAVASAQERVYGINEVSVLPSFPGGETAMYKWINSHFNYPADAVHGDVQGKLIITFEVSSAGRISNVKVPRGMSDRIDSEARRVMEVMPLWAPAVLDGRHVAVAYSIPMNFRRDGMGGILIEGDNPEASRQKAQNESKSTTASASNGTRRASDPVAPVDITVGDMDGQPYAAPEPEKVYSISMVDQKPEFPGGTAAMYRWISDNINYPAQASEEGVQGRVVVSFTITKSGEITDVSVERGRHPALDAEAVRLVRSMPRWQPGRNNGNPVDVTYTLPITFFKRQ